jgi:hypothetical protein
MFYQEKLLELFRPISRDMFNLIKTDYSYESNITHANIRHTPTGFVSFYHDKDNPNAFVVVFHKKKFYRIWCSKHSAAAHILLSLVTNKITVNLLNKQGFKETMTGLSFYKGSYRNIFIEDENILPESDDGMLLFQEWLRDNYPDKFKVLDKPLEDVWGRDMVDSFSSGIAL